MKAQKLAFIVAALAFLGACATEPEKPAAGACARAAAARPSPGSRAPCLRRRRRRSRKPTPSPSRRRSRRCVNLASTELFEFNKAVLTHEARAKLDNEVVAKLGDLREVALHHRQRPRRPPWLDAVQPEAVGEARRRGKAYLVSKGVDAPQDRDPRLRQDAAGEGLPRPEGPQGR